MIQKVCVVEHGEGKRGSFRDGKYAPNFTANLAPTGSSRFLLFLFLGINKVRGHSPQLMSNCIFIQVVDSKYEAIIKTEWLAKFNLRCGQHT
jgi:hypothetical protein